MGPCIPIPCALPLRLRGAHAEAMAGKAAAVVSVRKPYQILRISVLREYLEQEFRPVLEGKDFERSVPSIPALKGLAAVRCAAG